MKEKNQMEKNAAEKQVALITEALKTAAGAKGYWLNPSGKRIPKIYPKGVEVSPFNALVMGLHSDKTGSRTNLFMAFSEAKAQGTGIREHEKGAPFLFYHWKNYVNIHNPDDMISRDSYLQLDETLQKEYKGIHNREIRTLFTLDQSTFPYVKPHEYEKLLKEYGTAETRDVGDADERKLHVRFNDFLLKIRENLVPIRTDGSGMAHYESDKDAVYLPRQKDFEHYNDYVQEALRQIVSATGHQQRLSREGMVMKNGVPPSEDAVKQERLIVEVASGIKMLELGLPARISKDNMKYTDYWIRELKENPQLIDTLESDVNNALGVINKAERGERIEYAHLRNRRETMEMQEQLPKHFYVADEIRKHPDQERRNMVVVIDKEAGKADVILPEGASPQSNDEIQGMNKLRIQKALQREGIGTVNFYNPDGAFGYRPDDTYFDGKEVTVARLKNWSLETLASLDPSIAVHKANEVNFEHIQMIQDDKERWALYLKPEGKEGYSIYPNKDDLNRFFVTLKQSLEGLDRVRQELAHKYYTMAETKPELKVDLFGSDTEDTDLGRIERVSLFKTKNSGYLCAATIDGKKMEPRGVTARQWQRMWLAENKDEYKRHLAATLFKDILHLETKTAQDNSQAHEESVEQTEKEEATIQEEIKEKDKSQAHLVLKQLKELKAKHPDAILLFRVGDSYRIFKEDATRASDILGITLARYGKHTDEEGKPIQMASFPYHALDVYLPKLVRAGERVAICDLPDVPQRTLRESENQEKHIQQGIKR